jgi:lactoylglutathione lyase
MKQVPSKLAHVAMQVRDMEKSLAFYCDGVGMTKAFSLADEKGEPWIEYLKICDGVFLELFYGGGDLGEPSYEEIGYNHLCLTTGDADSLAARLHTAGYLDEVKPDEGGDGSKTFWARDPDGNKLEFTQYSPECGHMKANKNPYNFEAKGLTGVGHVGYVVSDMAAALAFYRDQLGLDVVMEMDKDGKPWIKFLYINDGSFAELFEGGVREQSYKSNYLHLCLECVDVAASVEELRARGVEIDVEPKTGADNNTQAWIHDPDGNKIELMQISPDSPQAKA